MKRPDVKSLLTEKMFTVFYDIPALKLGQQFTGTAAETTTAIFPVKRRYFSRKTLLTPIFFRLKAANATIFPVQRRQRRYF